MTHAPTANDGKPKTGSVESVLASLADKKIFFDPLHGNNGDELIVMGSLEAIHRHQLQRVDDASAADVIIVPGGAGLSSVWGGAIEEVLRYCDGTLGQKTLVILPSTMSFDNDRFRNGLATRLGSTYLFARERKTLDRIKAANLPDSTHVALDHDMAFQLRDSIWLKQLRSKSKSKHVLVVERRDAETLAASRDGAVPVPSFTKKWVPQAIKRLVKRQLHEKHRRSSPFADWAKQISIKEFPHAEKSNFQFLDVSLTGIFSFESFCKSIVEAEAVISTRLHVAILSALLDKPTVIVPGSKKFGKIQGIYDYSMSDMKHVTMVENPFDESGSL
ncbi:MAG: polysaccharide pyruvyl transferase family protein [Planctomycetota bacterium]